jgi:hypothetical protein
MMTAETQSSYSRWSKYDIYSSMWQAAPTREPLSEDEIMRIVNAHEGDTIGVVRAIEKAHGIGVGK